VVADVLSSPGKPAGGSAAWSDVAVIIPWNMYLSYGDKRILEAQYQSMAKWVEYERQRAGDDYIWDGDFHFGDRLSYPAVTTDHILRDGDRVELGDVTMTAHLTPGHTKGCTTWTMKVKEHLKSYDVVFVGSTTVPGYNLVDNAQYPTIAADYQRTFRVLLNLPCDVFLASHGSFYSMQEKSKLPTQGRGRNPFVDPRGYRRFIAQTENAFRQDLRRQEKARANGSSAPHSPRIDPAPSGSGGILPFATLESFEAGAAVLQLSTLLCPCGAFVMSPAVPCDPSTRELRSHL